MCEPSEDPNNEQRRLILARLVHFVLYLSNSLFILEGDMTFSFLLK